MDQIVVMSSSGAKAGGGGQGVKLCFNRRTWLIEGGEHGAADISGVSGWDDGIFYRDHSSNWDVSTGWSSWAGIRHEGSTTDDGGAEKFCHFGADLREVFFFFFALSVNCFGVRCGLFTHCEEGRRVSEFSFEEFENVFPANDATGVEISDHGEHVINLWSGTVAGFDKVFCIHMGREIECDKYWGDQWGSNPLRGIHNAEC